MSSRTIRQATAEDIIARPEVIGHYWQVSDWVRAWGPYADPRELERDATLVTLERRPSGRLYVRYQGFWDTRDALQGRYDRRLGLYFAEDGHPVQVARVAERCGVVL